MKNGIDVILRIFEVNNGEINIYLAQKIIKKMTFMLNQIGAGNYYYSSYK